MTFFSKLKNVTGDDRFYAFLEKHPEFAHVTESASKPLSSRAGYNRTTTKKIFELRIYLYGKDPLHTYTFLMKLSVRTYTKTILLLWF
jgi:hypothetical protein